jgi:serine O-acetyltransferase
MTGAVPSVHARPGVWSRVGEDMGDHLIPDPVAAAIRCLLDRSRMLEQEVGGGGCLPGGTEQEHECRGCDAPQVCDPPDQARLRSAADQTVAEA